LTLHLWVSLATTASDLEMLARYYSKSNKWMCACPESHSEVLESDESDVIHYGRLIGDERPMWKPEHRLAADRSGLRYSSG